MKKTPEVAKKPERGTHFLVFQYNFQIISPLNLNKLKDSLLE